MCNESQLKDKAWLARRMGFSEQQVQNLLLTSPKSMPPHLKIGIHLRFCPKQVEQWIQKSMVGGR